MKRVLVLPGLLLMANTASAHDWLWWCGTRAEYGPDYQAARASAPLCRDQLVGLAETSRVAEDQRILTEYERGLPSQLEAPRYIAPLLPRR
jgi:hypothetical protein